jgi:hypothetical protein
LTYISIDGDDIGRRVTARHLANDAAGVSAIVALVHDKVTQIERLLVEAGYTDNLGAAGLYPSIQAIGGHELTFSAGVGQSLREAYVALLSAKSNGKARLCIFSEMG